MSSHWRHGDASRVALAADRGFAVPGFDVTMNVEGLRSRERSGPENLAVIRCLALSPVRIAHSA